MAHKWRHRPKIKVWVALARPWQIEVQVLEFLVKLMEVRAIICMVEFLQRSNYKLRIILLMAVAHLWSMLVHWQEQGRPDHQGQAWADRLRIHARSRMRLWVSSECEIMKIINPMSRLLIWMKTNWYCVSWKQSKRQNWIVIMIKWKIRNLNSHWISNL